MVVLGLRPGFELGTWSRDVHTHSVHSKVIIGSCPSLCQNETPRVACLPASQYLFPSAHGNDSVRTATHSRKYLAGRTLKKRLSIPKEDKRMTFKKRSWILKQDAIDTQGRTEGNPHVFSDSHGARQALRPSLILPSWRSSRAVLVQAPVLGLGLIV